MTTSDAPGPSHAEETLSPVATDAPLTAVRLAEILQEANVPLLRQVLRVLGADRTTALLADALQFEAAGGLLTHDGTRRRTPGGTFLQLVRQQANPHERRRLFPRPTAHTPSVQASSQGHPQAQAAPQILTWDEVTRCPFRKSCASRSPSGQGVKLEALSCQGSTFLPCHKDLDHARSAGSSSDLGWR